MTQQLTVVNATASPWADPALTSAGCCGHSSSAQLSLGTDPWHMALAHSLSGGAGPQQRLSTGTSQGHPHMVTAKLHEGTRVPRGQWVRGRCEWGMLVPTEQIQWSGVQVGCACVPNAPDYLSVSPLGTRTESEHGGHPGRPNWRPSQTVKRGECRGSAVVGWTSTAWHCPLCHPPWQSGHPWGTQQAEDQDTKAQGFLAMSPAAHPWFSPRNREPGATG